MITCAIEEHTNEARTLPNQTVCRNIDGTRACHCFLWMCLREENRGIRIVLWTLGNARIFLPLLSCFKQNAQTKCSGWNFLNYKKSMRTGCDSLLKCAHHGGDTTSGDGLRAAGTQRTSFRVIVSLAVRLKMYDKNIKIKVQFRMAGKALPFLRDRRTTHRRMAVDNPEIIGKETRTK